MLSYLIAAITAGVLSGAGGALAVGHLAHRRTDAVLAAIADQTFDTVDELVRGEVAKGMQEVLSYLSSVEQQRIQAAQLQAAQAAALEAERVRAATAQAAAPTHSIEMTAALADVNSRMQNLMNAMQQLPRPTAENPRLG
jgi:hypothetical protein